MRKSYTWTEEEIQIVKTQYINIGPKACVKLLPDKSYGSIKNLARSFGIKMNKDQWCKANTIGQNNIRKYGINLELFKNVQHPQIAYLLGLMWADGHLSKRLHEFVFTSSLDDMNEILDVFKFSGNWSMKQLKRVKNRKEILRLKIHHSEFCQFLQTLDYHIKSGATPTKVLNIIPSHLKHYWWRGYLDGDGCIVKTPHDYKIVFAGCHNQDWLFLAQLDPNYQTGFIKTKTGTASQGRIAGGKENVAKVLSYIYQNYETDKIGFSRKYIIYKEKYL